MQARDLTILIHLVGFLAGIALYAMLGVMTVRARGGRSDRIPLATAVLGLAWNSGALVMYTFRDFGLGAPNAWITAFAFVALGFLPAVVVHSTAQPVYSQPGARHLVFAAYALSTAAGMLQLLAAAATHSVPSRPALIILTVGFALVIVTLGFLMRGRPGLNRGVSVAGLAAFAVMALHLTQHAADVDSWPIELLGHHASLPLALVILYQDYRFALADIFLKRVVTVLVVVSGALALYVNVAIPHVLPLARVDPFDPRATVAMLALWTATVLIYPLVRRGVERIVDRVILRRVDYRGLRATIEAESATRELPEDVLDGACRSLAPALAAADLRWHEQAEPQGASIMLRSRGGAQIAFVSVPTAEPPAYTIEVGDLAGGRRLLSDDTAMLERVALVLARRIDAIRVTRERYERTLREQDILRLATEAELRALRAQLNPHFLFNALTTIGHLIQESPSRALDTLYRLTGLLRAVLKRPDGDFITLGEELELVESYLAIERARFEDRLDVTISVPRELVSLRVPPFVLQPLVENAVKHGIAPRRVGGAVVVAARVTGQSPDAMLWLSVTDSGVGIDADELQRRRASGVGLSNVERRLERHFGAAASLTITSRPGRGTTVEVTLPAVNGVRASPVEAVA
jgi:signal transduction histidine kinase